MYLLSFFLLFPFLTWPERAPLYFSHYELPFSSWPPLECTTSTSVVTWTAKWFFWAWRMKQYIFSHLSAIVSYSYFSYNLCLFINNHTVPDTAQQLGTQLKIGQSQTLYPGSVLPRSFSCSNHQHNPSNNPIKSLFSPNGPTGSVQYPLNRIWSPWWQK